MTRQAGGQPSLPWQTRRDAAERIKTDAKRLRARVLNYLIGCGAEGATDEEIQVALDLAGNTQRPRRRELVQAGLVRDSGRLRPTPSGRMATVWAAVRGSDLTRVSRG